MSPVPFADFVARSINLCKPPRRRPATQTKLAQVLREFAQVCDSTADISLDAVAAWLDLHPSRAPLTSFSLLRSFARAVKLASKQGMIPVNPFDIIPPSQWFPTGALDTPEKVRHLTVDQIGRLLARASLEAQGGDWEALRLDWLVKVYAFTGCRKNEALGLLTADVDLAKEVIWIRPNPRRPLKTKASRRRLPMCPELEAAARSWLPRCSSEWAVPHKRLDGPWLSGRPGTKPLDQVRALGARAGVPNVTILSIRHGFATAAEVGGFNELLLQRFLGHRQRRTQFGYRHEDLDQLRGAADQIRYD